MKLQTLLREIEYRRTKLNVQFCIDKASGAIGTADGRFISPVGFLLHAITKTLAAEEPPFSACVDELQLCYPNALHLLVVSDGECICYLRTLLEKACGLDNDNQAKTRRC